MAKSFQFDDPDTAIHALAERLSVVAIENGLASSSALGRVLAQDVVADRNSPAADVSAMDGYAIRLSNLQMSETIPVSAESTPGAPPPELARDTVVRVFTGAIVPKQTEAVVKREDTEEFPSSIRFCQPAMSTKAGQHIRRAGENAKAASIVLASGVEIAAQHQATLSNFGCDEVAAYSTVRVAVITTGDEVGSFSNELPKPWQLRNSNRSALAALVGAKPWAQFPQSGLDHCKDDREALTTMLADRLQECDAILLTGGVSMGDYDDVPDVVREVGGEVVFHGLPIRPGKPILGAATSDGKLIMGLPGNPVSATIGCLRMVMPLLAKISGQTLWRKPSPLVRLQNAGDKTLPLHWMRLVRLVDDGVAEPITSRGSGDLVSLGKSTGFVELPPGKSGEGPWPYFQW